MLENGFPPHLKSYKKSAMATQELERTTSFRFTEVTSKMLIESTQTSWKQEGWIFTAATPLCQMCL